MKQKNLKSRVLFPIGAKLVLIISILMLVSLGAVIIMVSVLSTREVRRTAEDNNFTVNNRAGSQAEGAFKSSQAAVLFYLEAINRIMFITDNDAEMDGYFFSRNQNIAAIGITGSEKNTLTKFIPNTLFLQSNNISEDDVATYLCQDFPAVEGELRFYNASPFFQLSLLTNVFIRQGVSEEETIKVLFIPDELSDSFGTGTNTSFLINSSGDLLLHPDTDLYIGGANFSSLPIVEIMLREGDSNRQVSYNSEGKNYFGAYYRISGTDLAVVTIIPHSIVFEATRAITLQNIFLTVGVLFLAIVFIWFFSKTISSPVRELADAALRIEGGEFEVMLEPRTRDELGLLTESFRKMSSALGIFGRFTNRDIAVRAMRGQIKPGGQLRHATVFFSDIRGFTKKSENFASVFGDEAPDHIVSWLNDYFTHMIQCVEKTDGQVDKFMGDGVMAHWGTLHSDRDRALDAYNCVKAALLMREALVTINAERKSDDPVNPPIRIGCGINSGMVTAGQIGSEQRMEYTAIGDSVNVASRIEPLNKIFGTDILISEDTWNLIGDKFITEKMPKAALRGKEKPVQIYTVVNFKDSQGPQTMTQVRTLLDIETPDINTDDVYQVTDVYSAAGSGRAQDSERKRFSLIENRESKYRRQILDRRFLLKNSKTKINPAIDPEAGPVKNPVIITTSFGSFAWIHGNPGKTVPVKFSWNISNYTEDTHVIIEVANDPYFTRIIEKRDLNKSIGEPRPSSSIPVPLSEGTYWWRIYPATGSNTGPVTLLYPFGVLVVDTHAKKIKF